MPEKDQDTLSRETLEELGIDSDTINVLAGDREYKEVVMAYIRVRQELQRQGGDKNNKLHAAIAERPAAVMLALEVLDYIR